MPRPYRAFSRERTIAPEIGVSNISTPSRARQRSASAPQYNKITTLATHPALHRLKRVGRTAYAPYVRNYLGQSGIQTTGKTNLRRCRDVDVTPEVPVSQAGSLAHVVAHSVGRSVRYRRPYEAHTSEPHVAKFYAGSLRKAVSHFSLFC